MSDEGKGLVGLAAGIGLGAWSLQGGGGIALGLLAIAVIVGSVIWLLRSLFL